MGKPVHERGSRDARVQEALTKGRKV